MLPNFIIIGAPKAGTTSLYHYLSEHPQVFMSEPKEVNYFSREEIIEQGLYYKDFKAKNLNEYKQLFETASNQKAIGEGSVSYLFYPKTAEKIKACISNVKIIMLLRNPMERGYSHYLMDYKLGLVDLTYEEIVYKKSNHKYINLYYQQYVELGLYYEQVKRYLELFDKEQIKIYFQEDLRENSEAIVDDLYDFLNIEKSSVPNTNKEHNAFSMPKNKLIHKLYGSHIVRTTLSKFFPESLKEWLLNNLFERTKKPVLDNKIKTYLLSIYKPDIQNLEKLLNKNLSYWYNK